MGIELHPLVNILKQAKTITHAYVYSSRQMGPGWFCFGSFGRCIGSFARRILSFKGCIWYMNTVFDIWNPMFVFMFAVFCIFDYVIVLQDEVFFWPNCLGRNFLHWKTDNRASDWIMMRPTVFFWIIWVNFEGSSRIKITFTTLMPRHVIDQLSL